MAVVTAVRTRVSYVLIILSQDLHRQYRQGGMWNKNRHIQKICVFQTGAHLSMTVYKLHWSTKILSHKEKCLSLDVFLDAEFKYVSRISLSPTFFTPG